MNFKSKWLVGEWKPTTRMSYEKFFHIRIPSNQYAFKNKNQDF